MTSKYFAGLLSLLSVMALAPVAGATPIVSRLDMPSGTTTINFDTLSISTLVDNQYQGLGVTFSSPAGPGGVIAFSGPGQVLSITSEIVANFSVNVDAVGVDVASYTPLFLEAYDSSNTLIETVSITSQVDGIYSGFLGISSANTLISKVIMHDHGFGFTIDNFSFVDPPPYTQVPEPGTVLLLGSGLLGLGLWGLRKKRGS